MRHKYLILIPILLASCNKANTLSFKQTNTFQTLHQCQFPKTKSNEDLDEKFIHSTFVVMQKMLQETNSALSENFAISPISLYYALSMLRNGTENTEEFNRFMDLNDTNVLNENIKNHYQKTYLNEKNAQMQVANSLWVSQDYHVQQTYLDFIVQYYYADVYHVDFTSYSTLTNMAK